MVRDIIKYLSSCVCIFFFFFFFFFFEGQHSGIKLAQANAY